MNLKKKKAHNQPQIFSKLYASLKTAREGATAKRHNISGGVMYLTEKWSIELFNNLFHKCK